MKKILKSNNFIHIVLHLIIGLDFLNKVKEDINSYLILIGLFLFITINNYLRVKFFYKDNDRFFLSMLIYMILSNILIYNMNGYVDIFNFMIMYELILFTEGSRSKIFIGLSILSTFFISIFRQVSFIEVLDLQFWRDELINIAMLALYLFYYSFTLFAYKALRTEKTKVDRLNKDLQLSYKTLMEQSEKIEELTIAKERNRVAGEIHDTLGHNLVALNMNLDVAGKIMDKDIEKTKELLNKSKSLAKESMESLRKAVYALKEENPRLLAEKLEEIINNIQSTGSVEVILNQDEEVETLPLQYKNIIYNSIKEALTNSIKHGNSDKINIYIKLDEEGVYISIQDNGMGCSKLIKGNGLLGIESRVKELNGKVDYHSELEQGFKMKIKLVI